MAGLPTLAALDVIPVEHVDNLLATMHGELATLEDEVVRARHEADEAERRVLADGTSPDVAARATEHVLRFLDDLEAANDRDLSVALSEARATADRLLAEAHAEAELILAEGRSALGRAAVSGALSESIAAALELAPVEADETEDPSPFAPTSLPAVLPAVPEARGETPDGFADAVAHRVAEIAARVTTEALTTEALTTDALTTDAPPFVTVEPAAVEPSAPLPAASTIEAVADEVSPAYDEFWDESAEAGGSGRLGLIPLEAVLPMIALVIVLVVVLAWIG